MKDFICKWLNIFDFIYRKKIILIQSFYRGHLIRSKPPYLSVATQESIHAKKCLKESKSYPKKLRAKNPSKESSNNNPSISLKDLSKVMEEYPFIKQLKTSQIEVRPIKEIDNNSYYYGEWDINTNKRHGRGIQLWKNGSRFEGYFIQDRVNIQGKLIHSNGDTYSGEWKNDKANGYGEYHHVNGEYYKGSWIDDKQSGKGVEIWKDGSYYEGSYKDGMKNGIGFFHWFDNSSYSGSFKNNNIDGKGKYIWADNRCYDGEWKNNKMEGYGIFTYPDGRTYKGYFKNDKREGKGEFTYADGRIYKGMWANGLQQGEGSFYNPKTKQWKDGKWEKGKKIE